MAPPSVSMIHSPYLCEAHSPRWLGVNASLPQQTESTKISWEQPQNHTQTPKLSFSDSEVPGYETNLGNNEAWCPSLRNISNSKGTLHLKGTLLFSMFGSMYTHWDVTRKARKCTLTCQLLKPSIAHRKGSRSAFLPSRYKEEAHSSSPKWAFSPF